MEKYQQKQKKKNAAIALGTGGQFAVYKNHSIASDIFRNVDGNSSVRDGFSRRDYAFFRPEETAPNNPKDIILACRNAYRKIGLVNNIVNLMSDFTTQGVRLVHPNKKIQKFYNEWWNKVGGNQVSGKFSKNMYRDGIAVVQRTIAKLKAKDIKNLENGYTTGAADVVPETPFEVVKKEVPWRYTFLNAATISPVHGELSIFSGGEMRYALDLPFNLIQKLKNPKPEYQELVNSIPADIVASVRGGVKSILLDNKKVTVFHYKKDDWEEWADPMLYCVMDDLILLNKLKLADLAALDSAISHIRIWKLGSITSTPRIAPNVSAMRKLADLLMNNVGGGGMDLVWGPDLELSETGSDVYKFLGTEKYGPTLNAIYAGLGIPPTLTGNATGAGFTNNYVSLQTLLERLKYVRMILSEFWEREVKIVQRAMGFAEPAQLQFDRMTLTDANAEKALLIQLLDRGIISEEVIKERFGEIPELEDIRLKKEARQRKSGKRSGKLGPYAQRIENLEKIFAQTGILTPSELGLELEPRKAGEKTALEARTPPAAPGAEGPAKKTGVSGEGRPLNSDDTTKRKPKKVLPRGAKAELTSAISTLTMNQKAISDFIDPIFLNTVDKKNIRSLSDKEFAELENFKFALLCSVGGLNSMNEQSIINAVNDQKLCIPNHIQALYNETLASYVVKFGTQPSVDNTRQFQVSICAFNNFGEE